MISVCLATYNGEFFLRQQLESILSQISDEDEVIVQDDFSTDSTVDIINSIEDPRILLEVNGKNLGVVRTFELALSRCTGEVIFLSDQDDVWLPWKYNSFMDCFADDNVTLVLSDCALIDEYDNLIYLSYFDIIKTSHALLPNVIKNRYVGCCMAFRRDLLRSILPFPSNIDGHDNWIGLVALFYGRVMLVKHNTLLYRRHGGNASSMRRRVLIRAVLAKFGVVCALFRRVVRMNLENRRYKRGF